MNKRQKKKNHIYPFSDYGVDIEILYEGSSEEAVDSFFFNDLFDYIEANGLYAGGGGGNGTLSLTIGSNFEVHLPSALEGLLKFIKSKSFVTKVDVGEYVDMWYPDRKLHEGDKKNLI